MVTTQELRQRMIAHRKSLLEGEIQARSQQLIEHLIHWPLFLNARRVLLYLPVHGEIDLRGLLKQFDDKIFFLPRMKGEDLEIVRYEWGDPLQVGRFGVSEPSGKAEVAGVSPDLILVPGVAFDRLGNRIGHGKGFYDRFLTGLNSSLVGVCYDFQLKEELPPRQEHDISMGWIVTEQEIVRCR